MHEALAEARRQLGDGVTVLHTKQCDSPALFGLARKRGVEILAAVDTLHHRRSNDSGHVIAGTERLPESSPIVDRLVQNGVPNYLAESLCKSVEDLDVIINNIAQRINVSGPIDCSRSQARVALVGPTGVGKTTTAAKLAAHYSHFHNKKVALLTLDTYRIAAVEQLAVYARILNVPFEIALCPEDVDALIAKHADKDLILIDTVGRSQRNREHVDELGKFVRAANPTEVHLVVSASASPAAQKESVNSFGSLRADRLILTKLDECPQAGCILGLAAESLLPFSYITYGQEVPDDITAAEKDYLARLVWEGSL